MSHDRLAFETIGNATIIVYDDAKPLFVTDPWIEGFPYFGSWTLSHEIPEAQKAAIKDCPFVWFSHGHPDHLNPDSLPFFKGKTILLPDHHKARIKNDLDKLGHTTRVLSHKKWVKLSEHVRLQCISDYYQDAIILIDVNGRLLVNTNDAIDRGWGRYVRQIIREYNKSFLLSLLGYGDADMINYYREDGSFIVPKAAMRFPVGRLVQLSAESYGVKYYVPFSTMHKYQRSDSIWAQKYTTPIDAFTIGFQSDTVRVLPAFVHWNCETDTFYPINPKRTPERIYSSEDFGDKWADTLTEEDKQKLRTYFQRIEHLKTWLEAIIFCVGGREYEIPLAGNRFRRKLHFGAPRHSLMTAIEYQIFDDLLIGNFMKTKLIGDWPKSGLYPDFTPYVARYADNAFTYSKKDLKKYFEMYRQRDPLDSVRHHIEMKAIDVFRSLVASHSSLYQQAKAFYWRAKKQ